jgi:hypothetical protein
MLSLGDEDVLMTGGRGCGEGEVYEMTRVLNMARGMWQQTHNEQPRLCHMQPAFLQLLFIILPFPEGK